MLVTIMWYYFDPEELEKMLILESQQKYIYLAAADQGLCLGTESSRNTKKDLPATWTEHRNILILFSDLL